MGILPAPGLVLVRMEDTSVSKGGLFVAVSDRTPMATIVTNGAVVDQKGETVWYTGRDGDKVILSAGFSYQEVEQNGENLRLVNNQSIMAVLYEERKEEAAKVPF